jgi:hypothetical protein
VSLLGRHFFMSITRNGRLVPRIRGTHACPRLVCLAFHQDNRVTQIGQRLPHLYRAGAVYATAFSFNPGTSAVKQRLPLRDPEPAARRDRKPVEIVAD